VILIVNLSFSEQNTPIVHQHYFYERLPEVVDLVVVSDTTAQNFFQKIRNSKLGKTCTCIIREGLGQFSPGCWEYICGNKFRFCVYLDANSYLQDELISPTMVKIQAGFRLFVSATPFTGGVRDFINIVQLLTHWEGEGWQVENGLGVVKRFISKEKSGNKFSKTVIIKPAT